tara:strand:- start:55 stop:627 length:573 start_codon:yes stop_codon:yes gene_type:complete
VSIKPRRQFFSELGRPFKPSLLTGKPFQQNITLMVEIGTNLIQTKLIQLVTLSELQTLFHRGETVFQGIGFLRECNKPLRPTAKSFEIIAPARKHRNSVLVATPTLHLTRRFTAFRTRQMSISTGKASFLKRAIHLPYEVAAHHSDSGWTIDPGMSGCREFPLVGTYTHHRPAAHLQMEVIVALVAPFVR